MTHQPHPCEDATVKPVAGALALMRTGFCTSESSGTDKHYALTFRFRTLADLQAAHREWLAFSHAAAPVEPVAVVAATDERATILQAVERFQAAYNAATPGTWRKGQTSHHTVTDTPHAKGYAIGEFHHAKDAEFCDVAHELAPVLLRAARHAAAELVAAIPATSKRDCDDHVQGERE